MKSSAHLQQPHLVLHSAGQSHLDKIHIVIFFIYSSYVPIYHECSHQHHNFLHVHCIFYHKEIQSCTAKLLTVTPLFSSSTPCYHISEESPPPLQLDEQMMTNDGNDDGNGGCIREDIR